MINLTSICPHCGEEYWGTHECEGTRKAAAAAILAAREVEAKAAFEREVVYRLEKYESEVAKTQSNAMRLFDEFIKETTGSRQNLYNNKSDSWDYVIADIHVRNEMGKAKYGTTLKPDTTENMLQHLYEELLDATVYIKTLLLKKEVIDALSKGE